MNNTYGTLFVVLLFILNGFIIHGLAQNNLEKHETNSYESFDMIIITHEIFRDNAAKLVQHKHDVGITAFIKTIQEIYDEYIGIDDAERIRYFIRDAVDEWNSKYVLLLGDITIIPMRQSAVSWDYYGSTVVPNVITDLYYADIYDATGSLPNWDSNGDGVFSEIHMVMNEQPYNETLQIIDELDGIPDICVGRLPCSNRNEAQNVIEKIVNYETTTYGSDWFNRLILLGGDTFPNVGGINEGEYVTEYISSTLPDFEPIKLWTSLGNFKPININREISKGAGFVSYSGHGFEYGFATSPPNKMSTIKYYSPYLLGLRNTRKYPVMYFDACLTASLDYTIFDVNLPCFAWSLVKKSDTGAIACIGSTRVGFGGFAGDPFIAGASSLHRYFFESYKPGILLGNMFISAQRDFIENVSNKVIYDPLTLQEFILLGDPSLKIGGYP